MAGSGSTTGKRHRQRRRCKLQGGCYVFEAIRLHDEYVKALNELDKVMKQYADDLNAARFYRTVCRNLADSEADVKSGITENISPGKKGAVKISLKDKRGKPVGGAKYKLYIPGEKPRAGNLGGDGTKTEKDVKSGPCFVDFPDKSDDVWEYLLNKKRYRMVTRTNRMALKFGEVQQWEEKEAITAKSYDDSYLRAYIDFRERQIAQAEKKAEDSAAELIKLMRSPRFQNHLYKEHQNRIPDALVESFYGVDSEQERKRKKKYREIDHYIALLTEDLHKTNNGLKFLDIFFDEGQLEKEYTFKDVWGFIGPGKAVSEATGKFLYNLTPLIVLRINEHVNWRHVKDLDKIVNGTKELRPYFSKLEKALGKSKFGNWLLDRVESLSERNRAAVKAAKNRRMFNKLIKLWTDPDSKMYDKKYQAIAEKHDAEKALDGAWFGMMLDSVAVALSTYNVFKELEKASFKDKLDLANDVIGALKTVAEAVEQSRGLRVAMAVESGADGQTIEMLTTRASAAKICVRVLTVFGVIAVAALTICDIYEAWGKCNWRVVVLSVASFGAMLIGLAYTGIGAVLSIVLAVIAYLIYEPPVVDFIQLSYWGEDYYAASKGNKIEVKNTIEMYFKTVYTLSVKLIPSLSDANKTTITITSGLLDDKAPVYIQIFEIKKQKGKTKYIPMADKWKKIYPGEKSVDGKGEVKKDITTWTPNASRAREIEIFEFWEIWPKIKRDDDTDYMISVCLDPTRNQKYSLHDSTKVEFPSPEDPKFDMVGQNIFTRGWSLNHDSDLYWPFPDSGKLDLNIYTKYAKGCTVKIKLTNLSAFPDKVVFESGKSDFKVKGNVTKISIPITRQDDDPFEIKFNLELYGRDGEEKDSTLEPGAGADFYIASNEKLKELRRKFA